MKKKMGNIFTVVVFLLFISFIVSQFNIETNRKIYIFILTSGIYYYVILRDQLNNIYDYRFYKYLYLFLLSFGYVFLYLLYNKMLTNFHQINYSYSYLINMVNTVSANSGIITSVLFTTSVILIPVSFIFIVLYVLVKIF